MAGNGAFVGSRTAVKNIIAISVLTHHSFLFINMFLKCIPFIYYNL
jgi:hypothetical protein